MARLGRMATATWLVGFGLLACAKPVPVYEGERRSQDETAILRANGLNRVLEIDGREQPGKAFELLPGEHRLKVKFEKRLGELSEYYESMGQTLRAYCDVRFHAEAAHLYRLDMSFSKDGPWNKIPSKPSQQFNMWFYLMDVTEQRVLERAVDQRSCHLPRDKNS